jgi:uroporphyrinogen-III synthase
MRLLVTRPQPEARRTAVALQALGHDVLIMPMLRIEATADVALGEGPWNAVIMTSINAARAITTHPRLDALLSCPAFVVGWRTGEAARAAGFTDVTSAEGNAAALARAVVTHVKPAAGRLLYLAGEARTGDIEDTLAAHGFVTDTVIVYRAIAASDIAPEIKTALAAGKIDGVLHFSQRSAQALLAAADAAGMRDKVLTLQHYCLSAQVADAIKVMPVSDGAAPTIHVATHADEQALIGLVS